MLDIKTIIKNYSDILKFDLNLSSYVKDEIMNDLVKYNESTLKEIKEIKKSQKIVITFISNYKYKKFTNDLLEYIINDLKTINYDSSKIKSLKDVEQLSHEPIIFKYLPFSDEIELDLSMFKINPFLKVNNENNINNETYDIDDLENDLNFNDLSIDNIKLLVYNIEQNLNLIEFYKLMNHNSQYVITNEGINNYIDELFIKNKNKKVNITIKYDFKKQNKIKDCLFVNLNNFIIKYLLDEINKIDINENEFILVKLSNIEFQRLILICDLLLSD